MKKQNVIEYFLENRDAIVSVYQDSKTALAAWETLSEKIQIGEAMSQKTFLAMVKIFSETCKHYETRLNKPDEPVKHRLNIDGWTIAKSNGYYKAFRKVKGKMQAVHLGKSLDNAAEKIAKKAGMLSE